MNDVLELKFSNRSEVISHDVYIWALIDGFLVVAILAGNILTILAVRFSRRLRSLISNLFILSLAISDMVVGFTLPYHLAFYLGLGLGKIKIWCLLRFFLVIMACCVSIWNLIAIAVDRYIAICYPLHYSRFMTKKLALILLGTGWTLGFTIAAIPLFWNKWETAQDCEFDEVLYPWYVAGIITPVFSMVWICLLMVYWRIWKEASKHAKQMRTSGLQESASDWKSVQVVLLIIGSFTVCWMPYFIVACTQIFKLLDHSSPTVYKAAFSLAMANSMMNPIIYAWKNSNFRRAFCRLLKCQSPDSQEHNNSFRSNVHRKSSSMAPTQQGALGENGTPRDSFYKNGVTSTVVGAKPNPRISGLRQCSLESRESSLDGGRDSFDDGVVIVIKNNLYSTSSDRKSKFKNMQSLSVQSNDDVISNHTTMLSFSHDTESEDNSTPKRFLPEEPPPVKHPQPPHINIDSLNNNYILTNNNNNSICTLTTTHNLNNSTGNILVNKCAVFENIENLTKHKENQIFANNGKSAMTLSLSANSTALDCLGLAKPTSFDLFKNKSVECVINRNRDTVIGKIV